MIRECRHGASDLRGSAAPLLVRQGDAIDAKSNYNEERTTFTQVRAARRRKTLLLPLGVLVVLSTSTQSALPQQEAGREQLHECLCVSVAKIRTPSNVAQTLLLYLKWLPLCHLGHLRCD